MPLKQSCSDSVLSILSSDGPLGFEEIVRRVDYSRGTVNNHIRAMYNEGLVKQETGRGSRRYYLSEKGKVAAGKLAFAEQASRIVYEGKTANQMKSALENMRNIIDLALSKYSTNLDTFFSTYAQVTSKPITGIFKHSNPNET